MQQMLDGLVDSSIRINLRVNLDKTQVMFKDHVTRNQDLLLSMAVLSRLFENMFI